jgi:hypothetical protein
MAQILDVITQPLYDTNYIPAAGTQQVQYFTQPRGQGTSNFATSSTKTLADTNMTIAGTLPNGYNFVLLAFRLMPTFNMTIADATLALNGAVFEFTIGSKPYLQVPARTIPAGMGAYIGGAGTTTAASHGMPTIQNGFSISKQQLNLAQVQNFSATLSWPGGGQAVTTSLSALTTAGVVGLPITVFLDGFLQRLPQ